MTDISRARLSIRAALPLGVELNGDLRAPLDDNERIELARLLDQHSLLLFRGQQLTHDQQVDIMSCCGPILRAPDGIGFISNDKTKGGLGAVELAYHSDLAFTSTPFRAISLLAIDVIDGGSSTRFASSARALNRLPQTLRARLDSLQATAVMPVDMSSDRLGEEIPPGMPHFTRPVVVAHPNTGAPLLYINQQHAVRIEGVSAAEGRALLLELFGYLYAADNLYEHYWHHGDFVIWDNLALQHARGSLQGVGRRTLQRVVVAEKSFFELCPQVLVDDPEYKAWVNSTDPVSDRHLIERVVARGSGLL